MSFVNKLKAKYEETLDFLSDPRFVPIHIAEERLKICEACPSLTSHHRCVECGCFMKVKTKIAVASCPLPEKKWNIYEGR